MIDVVTQPKTTLKFNPVQQSLFFATARRRVDAYFAQRNLSPHANRAMWQKAVFFLLTYGLLYGLILSNQFGGLSMLIFALLLGFCAAGVGFNVSHDAIHGAFSAQGWVNRLLSKSFGSSGFIVGRES